MVTGQPGKIYTCTNCKQRYWIDNETYTLFNTYCHYCYNPSKNNSYVNALMFKFMDRVEYQTETVKEHYTKTDLDW